MNALIHSYNHSPVEMMQMMQMFSGLFSSNLTLSANNITFELCSLNTSTFKKANTVYI